jgi:hypothetical protein
VQGAQGVQGVVGPPGAQGLPGPQGIHGYGVDILGELPTVASLPPATSKQPGDAYIITEDGDLHVVSSDNQTWVDAGQIVGPTGPQGVQGPQGGIGATGSQGIQGVQGIKGDQGIQGIQGIVGPVGPLGPIGPVGPTPVIELTQAQYDALGTKDPAMMYVITDGADRTVMSGTRSPAGTDGIMGDFWINTAAWTISGPKASSWPAEVSVVGPQGLPGPIGPAGPQGAQGVWVQMTQAAYTALGTKDPNTLYVIVG